MNPGLFDGGFTVDWSRQRNLIPGLRTSKTDKYEYTSKHADIFMTIDKHDLYLKPQSRNSRLSCMYERIRASTQKQGPAGEVAD